MTKNNRLKDARIKSGKSQQELADLLHVSQAYINGLENDKPFSLKKAKIIAPMIGVDAEWLYFGDKKVVNSNSNDNITHRAAINRNETNSDKDYAPYLENVSASAGLNFLMDNSDATSYIKIPGAGVDAYINVFGDSMYPKYCAGEIIGVKEVLKDDLFFGHAYVVQMSDGEPYIKYIMPGKDEDHWSLESENPKYPARQFHLSKINKIFKIKTTVTKNSL